jgi:hypothetical protein
MTRLSGALELLKHLPEDAERARQELALQSVLGRSLSVVKGFSATELEPVFSRARALCAQIGEPVLAFRPLYGQWVMHWWKLELDKALELADETLALAEKVKDPAMLLTANLARGATLFYFGKFVSSNEHLEKALAIFDLWQPLSEELEFRRIASFGYLTLGLHTLVIPIEPGQNRARCWRWLNGLLFRSFWLMLTVMRQHTTW